MNEGICKCRCGGNIIKKEGKYGKYHQCDKTGMIKDCRITIPGYYNLTNEQISDLIWDAYKKIKVEQVSKSNSKYFINIWLTDDNDEINKEHIN